MSPPQNAARACLSGILLAGGVFTFPLLSPVLAERLSQPQLTSIVLAGMAGQYPLTPLVGAVIDRHGPRWCSLIASVLFCVAFGGFAFQTEGMLTSPTPPPSATLYLLVVWFAFAGFATVFAYFSSLFAATRMFSEYPGAAAGVVMALFGLSPLFLSFVASTVFTRESLDLVGFLRFLSIATGVVLFTGAWTLPSKADSKSETAEPSEQTPLLGDAAGPITNSVWSLLRDPYFWFLFFVLTVTLGPCEMIISNVGTIVTSLPPVAGGSSLAAAASQVKILSICNTLTRLVTGPFADFVSPIRNLQTLHRHHISRAAFLVLPASILGLAFGWMQLCARSQGDVWILSAGTGIAYGATFTVLPSIISAIWGAKNQGRNFGIVVFAPLTGTTIFSYLFAFVVKRNTSEDEICRGSGCWRITFGVAAALQLVAVALSLLLWRRWRALL
ncbi:MFS general substrate transporter [Mycena kentingensis (nom. inval.)]|nr:MFS general substrate transporter [Mycena kentingensis (nom. inval.)]